ncbi:MAG: RnfABCDGE type electron transport complex subunit C [Solobacterium sp.]|jgi:electron transport complex protein RnfC|nr:RnfABCDGE type electron transport complex subunit C [Solobacterium sp.]MCH4222020.1 RnfABCDGE type electron transport complex subunit C [Solobacterium sp.]MCH4266057.1 RnfABCDGE type electron transport complex subunit C [Solobacterium sp.]
MSILTGPMHWHLDGHKDLTAHSEVRTMPDPDIIRIPLFNGNAVCTPLVKVGDEVKAGQKIAERNDHFYLPLYSPVSGTVTAIEKRQTSVLKPYDHLVITNDHKNTFCKPFETLDYEKATNEELLAFVKEAGPLGLGGAGFPTYVKYLKPENVDLFIINAVECEPYLTSDYANALANPEQLKTGALALFKLSTAKKACVAVKEDKKELIASLTKTFEGTPVEVHTVPDIYPAGWERELVWLITGKRYGKLPMEAGCILNNVSTCIALGDALSEGRPIMYKTVTVSGDGVKQPQNVIVPVGTMASDIIQFCGGYEGDDCLLIAGGPMMGKTIPNDQFVIGYACGALTVLKHRDPFSVKCLRCGKCTEVCPAGMEPVRINNCEKLKDVETLKKLDINSCIECGLCTYICPSMLDVTEGIRKAKRYMALVK